MPADDATRHGSPCCTTRSSRCARPTQAWSRPTARSARSRSTASTSRDVRVVERAARCSSTAPPREHIAHTRRTPPTASASSSLLRALDAARRRPRRARSASTRHVRADGVDARARASSSRARPARRRRARRSSSRPDLTPVRRREGRPGIGTAAGARPATAPPTGRTTSVTVDAARARRAHHAPTARLLRMSWTLEVPRARFGGTVDLAIDATRRTGRRRRSPGRAPWSAPDARRHRRPPRTAGCDARSTTSTRCAWSRRRGPATSSSRPARPGSSPSSAATRSGRRGCCCPLGTEHRRTARCASSPACRAREHDRRAPPSSPARSCTSCAAATLEIPGEGVALPPLYYGTVDATPLWVCLLPTRARAGMPDDEVRALLPHLEAALAWMRDFGDSDGDGLLEYVDETGHGLSNQGWKDSRRLGAVARRRARRGTDRARARCRRTPTRRRSRGADLLERVRPRRRRRVARLGGAPCATASASASGSTDADGALPGDRARRAEAPGRHGHQQHRPPARHRPARRPDEARARRAPAGLARARLRLRPAHHVDRLGRLLAALVPRRQRLDPRHRDRRSRGSPRDGFDARGRRAVARACCAPPSPSTTGCRSCTPATRRPRSRRSRTRRLPPAGLVGRGGRRGAAASPALGGSARSSCCDRCPATAQVDAPTAAAS